MSIILKRGLEGNRSGLSLQPGEPIFTTDTKRLYFGITGASTGVELTFGQLTASFISASVISASDMKVDTLKATTIIGSLESASYVATASWANNAITASYALSATATLPSGVVSSSSQIDFNGVQNKPTSIDTASYVATASWALNAVTASYALNSTALPSGVVSSSSQIDFNSLQNKPTSIASASYVATASWAINAANSSTASYVTLIGGAVTPNLNAGIIQFDGTDYWLSI